jgi:hypothetical protein
LVYWRLSCILLYIYCKRYILTENDVFNYWFILYIKLCLTLRENIFICVLKLLLMLVHYLFYTFWLYKNKINLCYVYWTVKTLFIEFYILFSIHIICDYIIITLCIRPTKGLDQWSQTQITYGLYIFSKKIREPNFKWHFYTYILENKDKIKAKIYTKSIYLLIITTKLSLKKYNEH